MRSKPMILVLAFSLFALPLGVLLGQTPAIVPDKVEEDWKLVVSTPDYVGVGPQITTAMSPVGDDSTPFAAFDLNYREYPNFQAGGMQIQVWSGDNVLDTSSQGSAQFSTPGETVTWTQRMSIDQNGTVSYRVKNGQSTTWGAFGQGNTMTVSFSTSIDSLGGYSPDRSAAKSGASWESNYVSQLTLVQVRYYAAGRLVATDTTPRNVVAPTQPN